MRNSHRPLAPQPPPDEPTRAQERLSLISEALGLAIMEIAIVDGDPLHAQNEITLTQEYRRMVGMEHDSKISALDGFQRSIDPRDRPAVNAAFEGHILDRTGKTPCNVEYRLVVPGRELRWVRITACTKRDGSGKAKHSVCALRDIHDEKLTTLSLQNAMTRFELINLASSVALWDMSVIAGDPVNPKNEFWWSPQFRQMLGFRDETDFPNVLESWSSRLHPQEKDQVLTAFSSHLNDHSGRTPYDIEYQLQLKSGPYRWFRATGATSRAANGVPLRVAGALKDIHDEKLTVIALEQLIKAAVAGDFSQRIDVATFEGFQKEVGGGMNRILDSICESRRKQAELIKGVEANLVSVARASAQLTDISRQMAGTAEAASTQANTLSAAAEQVSTNIQTLSASTEEMSASIREIAKNAANAAHVATSAVKVVEATNETVAKLGDSSTEIGKVVNVIKLIAQQTNLLALNAKIEAARAGDAGKGFAVVADEVKDLARETAQSTGDISQKIEAIQNDTRSAATAITTISSIISQIYEIQSMIAAAVEEQTATTNEISRNIAQAARGSSEIAMNITGVATAARQTSAGASDTQVSATELSRMASELQALVARVNA
jgi:methyl-accepting chemotaxis protein